MSAKALKLWFFLKTVFFQFYFTMHALYCFIICVPVLAWKRNCHVILSFCRSPSFQKFMLTHWKGLFCFSRQLWVEKWRIQTFCCKTKRVFVSNCRTCKSSQRVRISILINRNYCSGFLFFRKKRDMDRDKKLNSMGENISRIGLHRFATPPNT